YEVQSQAVHSVRVHRARLRGPRARVKAHNVGRVPNKLPLAAKQLQARLDDEMLTCTRHIAAIGDDSWGDVLLALRFDARGQLLEVREAAGNAGVLDCVRYQLQALAGPGFDERDKHEAATYEVRRRYSFDARHGSGTPDEWLVP